MPKEDGMLILDALEDMRSPELEERQSINFTCVWDSINLIQLLMILHVISTLNL